MTKQQRTALISVYDKNWIIEFAQELVRHNIEVLSTGGTAKNLRDAGIPVIDVADYTGFPEMMGGRLKTLHPMVHGGILGRTEDVAVMEKRGMFSIDFVIVNLYPFKETIERPGCMFAEAIEQIDIGGPAMLRAAAKNHERVTVVCDPSDYGRVIGEITEGRGNVSRRTRQELARKVFELTSNYDIEIADYLLLSET